jgi:hypothetical protein
MPQRLCILPGVGPSACLLTRHKLIATALRCEVLAMKISEVWVYLTKNVHSLRLRNQLARIVWMKM